MADSLKLQVLKRLTALLEGIEPDIDTIVPPLASLEGHVFRGRALFGESDPSTMLSILEAPRPSSSDYADGNQVRKDTWLLLIQGFCPEDPEHPSDAVYGLMDLVERRLQRIVSDAPLTAKPLFPNDYMLGGLIADIRVNAGVVRPPTPNISNRCFFYLPVELELVADAG